MVRNYFIVVLLLFTGIQAASAQQATITTRTTGVATTAISFPGLIEMPVGAPYELRISSQFVPSDPTDPNTLYSTNAQMEAVLIIDGTEHRFAGRGIHAFGYTLLTLNGVAQTHFYQNMVLFLPQSDQSLSLSNSFGRPASELPASNVYDIFTLGSGSFGASVDNRTSVSLFDYGSNRYVGSVENTAATFEFSATLVAIPEPSSAAMLLAGLALLGSATGLERRRHAGVSL